MTARIPFTIAALLLASTANAQQAPAGTDHSAHHPGPAASALAAQTEGEVRKVDLQLRKLTLRHGPIANLDMPAMTMVFNVADAKLLDELKVGDKVRFSADKNNGAYIVTAVERLR